MACLGPASAGVESIREQLRSRNSSPRIFLPERAIVGEDMEIVVLAPGAKEVELLGSYDNSGIEEFEGELSLNLGKEFKSFGKATLSEEKGRANFKVNLSKLEDVGKRYYFEAIIHYPGKYLDRMQKALVFGSNAAFRGNNTVVIAPQPGKGKSAQFDFIRSVLPGLSAGSGASRY